MRWLWSRGVQYFLCSKHSSMGAPIVPDSMKATFRNTFKGTLILSGGYDAGRAERDLAEETRNKYR